MPATLHTDRMTLRALGPHDEDDLLALSSDPAVMRYLGNPATRADVQEHIPYCMSHGPDFGYWVALEEETFLGWFLLRPPRAPHPRGAIELGYRLHRATWGRGLATEGSEALLAHGFGTLGVERVFATTMAVNTGSRRVMEKAGLRYVRTFDSDFPEPVAGSEHGEVEYEIGRDDWRSAHPGRA